MISGFFLKPKQFFFQLGVFPRLLLPLDQLVPDFLHSVVIMDFTSGLDYRRLRTVVGQIVFWFAQKK
jgi:hypothetical protein